MLSDEQLDAGIAEVAYAAETPNILILVDRLVNHPRLNVTQKLVLLTMALHGSPMTAADIAAPLGITSKSVQYALRPLRQIGAVTTDEQPDYKTKKFVTVYELVAAKLPATGGPDAE